MPIVRFQGKVLPAHILISAKYPARKRIGHPQMGDMTIECQVKDSQIEIWCNVQNWQHDYLAILNMDVTNVIRSYTDLYSFGSGLGLLAFLETVTFPDGAIEPLTSISEELGSECTAYNVFGTSAEETEEQYRVCTMIANDHELTYAMSDLVLPLLFPTLAPSHCRRVLNSLRKYLYPHPNDREGWKFLQKAINVDGSYIRWVRDNAHEPTHGSRSYIDAPTVKEMMKRTWIVMNRVIEFKKRGGVHSLPADEFFMLP